MAELTNDFAWSKSRDEVFRACPRQYHFRYYGSWGGWEATAPEPTYQLYVLKQLKTRAMWAGERVHACIQRTLQNLRRGIDVLNPQKIIEVTIAQMREDYRSSQQGNYWKMPKSCALFEHEYGLAVAPEQWRQTAADVETCLHNFYTSDLFAKLRSVPRTEWLDIEELGQFATEGVKVWVKIDCSFREGERVRIIDWKTGRSMSDENTLQLVCYSLYAQQKWGVAIEQVRPAECYLLVNRIQDYEVSAGDVEAAKAYLRGSVADMHSLLADMDRNVPLAEAAFEKTDSLRECRRCNFVGPCRPEVLAELRAGTEAGAAEPGP